MKRKLLSILLMGVLIIGLTGCGSKSVKNNSDNSNNDKTVKSSKMYVLTCSHLQEADNEYEPTTNNIEEFTYDDNNVLKTIKIKNEYNYSTKELADKYRTSEEKSAERQNTYSGVKVEIDKVSETEFVVIEEYDIKNVDKGSVFVNSDKYLNDDNKFSVNEYKSYYESLHKNRDGKCLTTEK